MSRNKGVMSGHTKNELAKELGFADKVAEEGWGAITAGEAGSMVRRAVEAAERQMVNEEMQPGKSAGTNGQKGPRKPDRGPGKT